MMANAQLCYQRGAAGGIRTPDPRITNAMLYQLSYCGLSFCGIDTAGAAAGKVIEAPSHVNGRSGLVLNRW